jgi:tRNA nucleotidyltransferase (CCA-adding enzyme)
VNHDDVSPTVSPQALAILQTLEDAGYETWCVGGAIRDALLGDIGHDVDLATAATPDVVQRLFRRTVAVGIAHGTVGVLDAAGTLHEVTTFRRDVTTDGRHAVVAFGVSLDDDLARRDFTINAIAYHPPRHAWHDPFDGRGDLARRLLRAVGDPATRFREDRLRILRALRFAARLDLTIDPPTWLAAQALAHDTGDLSAERVLGEWVKGLKTARAPADLVRLWRESGVAAVWMPEATASMPAGDLTRRDPVVLTALACAPGATVWRRLKGSTPEIRRAERIDAGPAEPASAAPVDVRRWMQAVGPAADDLAQMATLRWGEAALWPGVMAGVRARGEATSRGELALTGADLIEAGVSPGPAMGERLERLLRAVIDDPALNTRSALLALLRSTP